MTGPLDDDPYMLQPYYERTTAGLRTAWSRAARVMGPVEVGMNSVRMTPQLADGAKRSGQDVFPAVPLAGYGARRGRSATGVRDDLHVKAMVIRVGELTVAWVSGDWLVVPPCVREQVMGELSRRAGMERLKVYWGATHTHCGPGGWGEGPVAQMFAGRWDAGMCEWLARCTLEALDGAVRDLRSGRIGLTRFEAPEFVRNRLVGEQGEVDAGFDLMVASQDRGRLGVLGVYGAHATVLGPGVMEFSGDYPGAWQRAVEAETGRLAMFMAGAVGSQSPRPGAPGWDGVERMGGALGKRALRLVESVRMEAETVLGWVEAEVEMPPLNWRVSERWRLRPWLARKLLRAPEKVDMQVARVGRSIWMATPCDFSGEKALTIKERLAARGWQGVVTSFNGHYVGYVLPAKYYPMEGYEPRVMSFYGPWVAEYFEDVLRRLAICLTGEG